MKKLPNYRYINETLVRGFWVFNSCGIPISIVLDYLHKCADDIAAVLKLSREEVQEALKFYDDHPALKAEELKIMKEIEIDLMEKKDNQFEQIMEKLDKKDGKYLN